jgi:hypothetical protein
MGLFLAKEYIRNENLSDDKGIPLKYNNKIHILKKDERFFCADDEFIEIVYTGDEMKLTYGNLDNLIVSNINGTLTFTVVVSDESKDRQNLTYPLTMAFSAIHVIKITQKEYEENATT